MISIHGTYVQVDGIAISVINEALKSCPVMDQKYSGDRHDYIAVPELRLRLVPTLTIEAQRIEAD
jgi:hypothetical protein